MRWLGKAPRVYGYDRDTILRELAAAGFVDVVEHDVGADPLVAFVVARTHPPSGRYAGEPDRS
jgi:hypothetical protein